MYAKIKNLYNLVNRGLNVHNFYIPKSKQEYENIVNTLQFCSIRTDSDKNINTDLPFYILKNTDTKQMEKIWNTASVNNYKLIISDGIKYDNIQDYNMVLKLQKNGNFLFEVSELKIPLRHMYRYPLLSCSGNLSEHIQEWTVYNQKYGIDKTNIKKDLIDLYQYQIFDEWLDITKYPIPVGRLKKKIVFW